MHTTKDAANVDETRLKGSRYNSPSFQVRGAWIQAFFSYLTVIGRNRIFSLRSTRHWPFDQLTSKYLGCWSCLRDLYKVWGLYT